MNLLENIKIALEGLRVNKMRTFLTMLGIIIGISSVIGIITLGDALRKSVSSGFDSIGNNAIQATISPRDGYGYQDLTERDFIKKKDIDKILTKFEGRIQSLSLSSNTQSGTVKNGRKKINIKINGVTSGEKDINKLEMIAGKFIDDEDVNQYREVVVISDKLLQKNFDNDVNKALGSELVCTTTMGLKVYTIVGVYKAEVPDFGVLSSMVGFDGDTIDVYIPMTVGFRQFQSPGAAIEEMSFMYFQFMAVDSNDTEQLSKEVTEFAKDNIFGEDRRAQLIVQSLRSQISQIDNVMNTVSLAIGAIAAISLLVGGIGVMNILLVSVTERTREIGIRKALGATNRDIRGQFIVESIIICIIGGLFGVALGGVIGLVGSNLMGKPTFPSLFSIIIATGFSMVIGIFFGYYPANKAAKLNPIDALRYE